MSKSLLTISYIFLLAKVNFLDQSSVEFPMVVGCTAAYRNPLSEKLTAMPINRDAAPESLLIT
jgi:hypothetical protein